MSDTTCYKLPSNNDNSSIVEPDGSQTRCVFAGYEAKSCCKKGDTCLEESVCQFKPSHDTESGYYIGGCVDKTFADSACSDACSMFRKQDIVYNSAIGGWACCSMNCSIPSQELIFGLRVSPEDLTPSLYSVSSVSTPSLHTSTSVAVTDILNTSQPSSVAGLQRASGLTVGSKAGIAVASVVGGLATLAAIYFLIRRIRSRKKNLVTHATAPNAEYSDQAFTGGKSELETRESMLLNINELDAAEQTQTSTGARSELDAGSRIELDAGMGNEPGVEGLIGKRVVSPIEAPGDGAEMSSELDVGNQSGERPVNDIKAAVVDTEIRSEQDAEEESGKKMQTT